MVAWSELWSKLLQSQGPQLLTALPSVSWTGGQPLPSLPGFPVMRWGWRGAEQDWMEQKQGLISTHAVLTRNL